MNIFVFDPDYNKSAEYHNDVHVSKMLLEVCQLLCTAHHVYGTDKDYIPYRKTHENHPCTKWVRESVGNYLWTVEFARALCREYEFRFEKTHGCKKVVDWCWDNIINIKKQEITDFVVAINEEKFPGCVVEGNVFESYKNYHRMYKQGFTRNGKFVEYKWTKRNKPQFMNHHEL